MPPPPQTPEEKERLRRLYMNIDAQEADDARWAGARHAPQSYASGLAPGSDPEGALQMVDTAAYAGAFGFPFPATMAPSALWLSLRAANRDDHLEAGIEGTWAAAPTISKVISTAWPTLGLGLKAGAATAAMGVANQLGHWADKYFGTPQSYDPNRGSYTPPPAPAEPTDLRDWSKTEALKKAYDAYPKNLTGSLSSFHPMYVPEGEYFGKGVTKKDDEWYDDQDKPAYFGKDYQLSRNEEYSRRRSIAGNAYSHEMNRVAALNRETGYDPKQTWAQNLSRGHPDIYKGQLDYLEESEPKRYQEHMEWASKGNPAAFRTRLEHTNKRDKPVLRKQRLGSRQFPVPIGPQNENTPRHLRGYIPEQSKYTDPYYKGKKLRTPTENQALAEERRKYRPAAPLPLRPLNTAKKNIIRAAGLR